MSPSPVIIFKNINKIYVTGDKMQHAVLKDISFEIYNGEFISIMGPSGSGKSTCMHIIGCLDQATSGQFFLNQAEVSKLDSNQLAQIRNQTLGFVFQNFNLLANRTLVENIALPLVYSGVKHDERTQRAMQLLQKVNLQGYENYLPTQLSGGMKQRVAIARALVTNPKIILADEPTGNLDTQTSYEILNLFQELNQKMGITIVMITHEPDIAEYTKRIIYIRDGIIEKDEVRELES